MQVESHICARLQSGSLRITYMFLIKVTIVLHNGPPLRHLYVNFTINFWFPSNIILSLFLIKSSTINIWWALFPLLVPEGNQLAVLHWTRAFQWYRLSPPLQSHKTLNSSKITWTLSSTNMILLLNTLYVLLWEEYPRKNTLSLLWSNLLSCFFPLLCTKYLHPKIRKCGILGFVPFRSSYEVLLNLGLMRTRFRITSRKMIIFRLPIYVEQKKDSCKCSGTNDLHRILTKIRCK